ncbi:unnamed protein product [Amoebophrya sp. A25]|nr:unnamed protein product [Amoebophrya sp. A25]|eukprot:GSA25T00008921001.1
MTAAVTESLRSSTAPPSSNQMPRVLTNSAPEDEGGRSSVFGRRRAWKIQNNGAHFFKRARPGAKIRLELQLLMKTEEVEKIVNLGDSACQRNQHC